ncbi:hypothetical protein A2U01_0056281, partial [Trifolium medium]|nr:hypothetical protein [Trifolium medium]
CGVKDLCVEGLVLFGFVLLFAGLNLFSFG